MALLMGAGAYQLVDSADAVKALKLENERLTASHQQEIDELRNERQQIVSIQKELHETRSENRSLFEKVRYGSRDLLINAL